jgi:hypothetical protein
VLVRVWRVCTQSLGGKRRPYGTPGDPDVSRGFLLNHDSPHFTSFDYSIAVFTHPFHLDQHVFAVDMLRFDRSLFNRSNSSGIGGHEIESVFEVCVPVFGRVDEGSCLPPPPTDPDVRN